MRQDSVFTFLKTKFKDLYELSVLMEKFIVCEKYKSAALTSKVILDLFSRYTDKEFVFTADIVNDKNLLITERDVKSIHQLLFKYIYTDYFNQIGEYLNVDYEFDFTY